MTLLLWGVKVRKTHENQRHVDAISELSAICCKDGVFPKYQFFFDGSSGVALWECNVDAFGEEFWTDQAHRSKISAKLSVAENALHWPFSGGTYLRL